MTLKVSITWDNANHALLPEAHADVKLDGGGVTLDGSAPGRREYTIADGVARVALKASFSASFGPVQGFAPERKGVSSTVAVSAGALALEVLRAQQEFDVVDGGTRLSPVSQPSYAGPHPLVDLRGAANVHGSAAIKIRTDFVDITGFWRAYAGGWGYYEAERKPGTQLVVLGSTSASPLIWFASIPDVCAGFTNGFTSCLVFFRPGNYEYERLDQPHQMSALARYLLKPKEEGDPTAQFWERDYIDGSTGYNLIRCGFEDALVRSRRAVVMLHPWQSGSSYGTAAGASLPSLCEGAIRLLWASQRICRSTGNVRLGRLGISGFSLGGGAMYPALAANIGRVDEVYAFDCLGAKNSGPSVARWVTSRPEARLRMAGSGRNVAYHQAIYRTIQTTSGTTAPLPRVSALPESEQGYRKGANPLWDHVLKEREDMRAHGDTRHQFAIFGGHVALPGPFAKTFLLRFLEDSLFQVA
ncbi:hypothetical protein [Sorangium sp. So ce131]|uniref:hypothetical protein n=1 Tax=Sorangium sp. So ce131 TaxID=3133282 RepID=UPI003F629797